jgi:hypothetical protein
MAGRFQIAVDHAPLVSVINGVAEGGYNAHRIGQRHTHAGFIERFYLFVQCFSHQVFHDHVIHVALVVEVENLDDVIMAQLGHDGRFLLKALDKFRVFG